MRTDFRRFREHWPLGVLALALVVFYWDFLRGTVFLWEDGLNSFYPFAHYISSSLSSGRVPLWMPGVSCGYAFYADPQTFLFYPPTWLLALFAENGQLSFVVYQRFLVAQIFLGGVLLYLFLREYKLRPVAMAAALVVFCFAGAFSVNIKHPQLTQVYIWLPLQLLLVKRLVEQFRPWRWVGLIVATSLSLLGGCTQLTVYLSYAVIAFWLYLAAMRGREEADRWFVAKWFRTVGKHAGLAVATFGVVGLLNAYLILPAHEAHKLSWRAEWDLYEALDQSLPPYHLIAFGVPNFFGSSVDGGAPMPYWGFDRTCRDVQRYGVGMWQYWAFGGYAGQLSLLALLFAAFNLRQLRDRRAVIFFLGACAVGIWYMLGRFAGLLNVLVYVLPMIAKFRVPTRMLFLVDFAFAVLVAFAVDALWQKKELKWRWPIGLLAGGYVVLLVAVGGFGGSITPLLQDLQRHAYAVEQTMLAVLLLGLTIACVRWGLKAQSASGSALAAGALVLVCFIDLQWAYGRFQRGQVNPDDYFSDRWGLVERVKQLEKENEGGRLGQSLDGKLRSNLVLPAAFPWVHPELELPEGDSTFNLSSITQFHKISNEMAKADLLNVRLLAVINSASRQAGLVAYTNSLPRAKFYRRVKGYESREDLLRALESGALQYRETVGVLSRDAAQHPELKETADTGQDRVRLIRQSPEQYTIEYNIGAPGIIFVSETHYPGWEVANGSHEIIEVFGAFKGIVMPEAGQGKLIVRFVPKVFHRGLWISGITALALVLVGLLFNRRFSRNG